MKKFSVKIIYGSITDHIVAEIVITLKLKVELVALFHQRLFQVALQELDRT